MKTAVTALQEMLMKMGQLPSYECVTQSGPKHQAMFEYRCEALGELVTAEARSKKEAKQEVARLMLMTLASKGHNVPAPFALGATTSMGDDLTVPMATDTRSYVLLLKELCEEFRLGAPDYELVGDTGPPHLRHFTMCVKVQQHERIATSTTKKAARQIAAEKLYTYLRENLARLTKDFDEDEALVRAHEKKLERHTEVTEENHPRRPDLGLKIAEYSQALANEIGEEKKQTIAELLETERERITASPERVVIAAADVMRLDVSWTELPQYEGEALPVLEMTGCSPEMAFHGKSREQAARQAISYLRLVLFDEIDF